MFIGSFEIINIIKKLKNYIICQIFFFATKKGFYFPQWNIIAFVGSENIYLSHSFQSFCII